MNGRAAFLCAATLCFSIRRVDAAVQVRVRAVGGDAVRDVYIGVIAGNRRSDQPVAETIAPAGSATLEIPAGAYTLVTGADGYEPAFLPLQVSPRGNNTVKAELLPEFMVTGTVTAANRGLGRFVRNSPGA